MSNSSTGIGEQALPDTIRQSAVLDAADLHLLASVPAIPHIDPAYEDERLKNIFQYYAINPEEMEKELHRYAKELLAAHAIGPAWQVLLTIA